MIDGCTLPHHALLPLTQWVVVDLSPSDWRHCADFLTGLLQRRPLSDGSNDATGWRAEQWILGCLATELRLLATEAGEPADVEPRTFGTDPVERAREQVATITESRDAAERDYSRRLGDAQLREARKVDE